MYIKQFPTDISPVVLVTGAATRLGQHVARFLHEQGWRIIIHYHQNETAALALAASLNAHSADTAAIVPCDFAKIKNLRPFVAKVLQIWGQCDALINNASIFQPSVYGEPNEAQWDELFSVNLKAPYYLVEYLQATLKKNEGVVINIGDAIVERQASAFPIYSLTKQALLDLTQLQAKLLAPSVRVHALLPGRMLTPAESLVTHLVPQQPLLKNKAQPQDLAECVLFLLQAKQLTAQILQVDAGMHLNLNSS